MTVLYDKMEWSKHKKYFGLYGMPKRKKRDRQGLCEGCKLPYLINQSRQRQKEYMRKKKLKQRTDRTRCPKCWIKKNNYAMGTI